MNKLTRIFGLRSGLWMGALVLTLMTAVGCSAPSDSGEAEAHDEHEEEGHGGGRLELSAEKVSAMELEFSVATLKSLPFRLETTGQVDFDENRRAHVTPRIPGRVVKVQANLGDEVRRGQELATLDSIALGRAKADYLQARAREQLTRDTLEREEGLLADRISSQQEVLAARAAYQEAEAALRNADETLHLYGVSQEVIDGLSYENPGRSLFSLTAPFSGTVVEKHVTLGELLTPESESMTIADLSNLWVWIDVYERDVARVHIGDDVEVTVEAYPGEIFAGVVSYISAMVDRDTRTIRARIDVESLDGRLRPGMFARVLVSDPHAESGDAAPAALVVPADAVQRIGDRMVVFVVLGETEFETREVHVARRAGDEVEIEDGLEPGERIVIRGAFLLKSEASKDMIGDEH